MSVDELTMTDTIHPTPTCTIHYPTFIANSLPIIITQVSLNIHSRSDRTTMQYPRSAPSRRHSPVASSAVIGAVSSKSGAWRARPSSKHDWRTRPGSNTYTQHITVYPGLLTYVLSLKLGHVSCLS